MTESGAAHSCALCEQPITESERWEYEGGAYKIGTPETAKRRVHTRCVAQLIRDTLAAFARVPDSQHDEITFEI